MKQNKLTFDTENLVVHWLEISIEGLYDLEEIQALANYFDKKLELNSTFRESAKRSSQSLISRPANKFNVLFVQTCLKYWSGTKLIFSGENGTHFYKLVQEKKVDWEILKLGSLSLSRFDVYYFEKINDSDESSVKYFLQDCVKNLEEKRKNISYSLSYGKKKGGYLLRIGSRQSSKHLRIYQKRNGLEFELEIKKQETKKRGSFLFSNQLEKFEDSSIRCYYEYLWNYLIFENPFTEWLVVGGRKLRMTRFLSDSLALSYLKPKLVKNIYQNFDKKPETFCFIQLLSFLDQRTEGPTYIHVRIRVALCILAVTGIRINELLPLKVNQLRTLIEENWIAIDRSKRGPSNHKAFLIKEGKKIINDRQKDFKFIFLMKEQDSYVFSAESNHFKQLGRVVITKDVNKIMRQVSEQLPDKPNITSHSFRIGYITQLWKDSKDIEFVKQTIGHRNLDTTSAYVNRLSDQERQKRIDQLK